MNKTTLNQVSQWAQSRVDSGQEPPWTYQKLKTLARLAEELSRGMEATIQMVPQPAEGVQDVVDFSQSADIVAIDSFRSPADEPDQVQLPT